MLEAPRVAIRPGLPRGGAGWHATRRPGRPRAHRLRLKLAGAAATRRRRRAARRRRPAHRRAPTRAESHSPDSSQRPAMQLRADAANARRLAPAHALEGRPARARLLERQLARLAPQYPVNRIQLGARASTTTSRGRITLPPPTRPRRWDRGTCGRAPRGGSRRRASRWRGRRPARRRGSAPPASRSARRRCAARRPPRPAAPPRSTRTCTSSQSPAWRPVRSTPRSCRLNSCQRQYWSQRPPAGAATARP